MYFKFYYGTNGQEHADLIPLKAPIKSPLIALPVGKGLTFLLSCVFLCVFFRFPMCVLIHIRTNGEVGIIKTFLSLPVLLTDVPMRCFFCGSFLLLMCSYFTVVSVPYSLAITCWEKAVCDVFLCFVTFPYGVSGQVWYLLVSMSDLCHVRYFIMFEL